MGQLGGESPDDLPLAPGEARRIHPFHCCEHIHLAPRPRQRRGIGHHAAGDEMLEVGSGPVVDGEVRRSMLGECRTTQRQDIEHEEA